VTTPFSRRTVVALAVVAATSFATGMALIVFEPELQDVQSRNADAFSYTAIGHRGFVEVLRRLGHPVVVSRTRRVAPTESDVLVVVAEPDLSPGERSEARLRELLATSRRVLLVLPKWSGRTERYENRFGERGWVTSVTPVGDAKIERVLRCASIDASVTHPQDDAPTWTESSGPVPKLRDPQLVTGPGLEPVLQATAGMLLARRIDGDKTLYVLSDPDVVANHGLLRGDNAALAVSAVEDAVGRNGVVLVDETLHGFEVRPSIWREMFSFPLACAVIQAAVALAALLWAGMVRFGAPRPQAPELGAGRRTLIDNTAELLAFGGHSGHSLRRYFDRAVEAAARTQPAEAGADAMELARRAGRRTRARDDVDALDREVRGCATARVGAADERRAVALALRIDDWRREVADGNDGDSGDR
jgi:hypothetical protein